MVRAAAFGLLVGLLALSTPAQATSGQRVTRILIKKQAHTMDLYAGDEIVSSHHVAIGPGGAGPKRQEGDMVTPVGRYHITMHQPSQYRIFLRLDYPTPADFKRFNELKARGDLPKTARIGGDIGIHGPPVSFEPSAKTSLMDHDWTAGCIAVSDDEIKAIAKVVPDGTVVDIED